MKPLFNIPEFTVSEFSRSIKRTVEDAFGYVKIKGEITGSKRAASGHVYFNLKDENAVLTAVFFRNMAQLVNFEIADGLQVTASGRITTFEGRSNYQIIVEKLEIAGVGALLEMIEKRRQKFLAEGLFDEVHKKTLPFFPKIIGVITSQTGAVIEDIKHRIEARAPMHLMLYPSLVQGEKAAAEIISGIKFFNKLKTERPELIIIARGGGSFEDLLCFNDEDLIREVFKSEIPIVSAVGHETDTTLIDYVSDLRAPTPTAAAELITPVLADLKNDLNFFVEKLNFVPRNFLEEKLNHIKNLQRYLTHPKAMLEQVSDKMFEMERKFIFLIKNFFSERGEKLNSVQISQHLIFSRIDVAIQKSEFLKQRLKSSVYNILKDKTNHCENLTKLLKTNDYHQVLKRGFALIKKQNGSLISSVSDVKIDEEISIETSDGSLAAQIKNQKLKI